jgi:hypothetical protein
MFVAEVQPMATVQKASSSHVSRPNLRRSRRQSPKSTTKVRAYRNALALGPHIAVGMLDVSETGIRLILKEPLAEKTEFALEFEPIGCRAIKALARVVWLLPLADGNYCIGANFSKCIAYCDLAALARS